MMLKLGSEQSSSERAAQSRAVKEMVRNHFSLHADDSIFVAEITCGETDCPDVETVVAVFLSGTRREFRIHKPIASVTTQDVTALPRQAD